MQFPDVTPLTGRLLGGLLLSSWLALPCLLPSAQAGESPSGKPKIATAVPAEELVLTMHRAVELALAKNYSIRVEAFQPAIAQARITGALGAFDPVLTARAQHSENNNPRLVESVGDSVTSLRTVNEELEVNVRALTPLGAILSVGTSVERLDASGPNQYSAFTGLTATQPLLRDFGPNAALHPIRLARNDEQASRWEFRQTITDIITETAQAYNDLYFARENLRVAERSRDLAARLLQDNTQRVKLGVLTPLDISVARSQLAAREETIILARQSVREFENALKLRVTDDVERFLAIRVTIAPPIPREPGKLDYNADLPHAFAHRPDYQQALLDLQRRQITLVFDRNQSQPRLDLSASFGSNGLARSLSNSLSQSYRGENTGGSVGVNLTLPFPNRAGRGRTEASRLDVARALLALKQTEQQIIVRLDNAAGEVRSNRARITAADEALRLSRESLEAEEKKLAGGTSTTFVVLQLQNELSAAESNALRAMTDYQKSLVEYEREAGRTLEVNRVLLDGPEGK
jgi:outer membrane protein